ncbi:phospho-glucose isomerase C-terminal SIS domain-containing protein [Raineyella antarctica]|uniref:Phospho-glucose isomerase C-terminal SIS domain-containing protein n=1 Tax=Raineyella antarctica TaxID=1577474 RepID=A0A1G6H6F0_9ACTN|nr:SIS domain-containing protein [Raineyella antarctica]SDB89026.1 phospho-glucose isomerase C-terminal SIS domain-containing protein [Raineyella antarctica]
MADFDDSRLEDREVLQTYDAELRRLAECGARLRTEWFSASNTVFGLREEDRPRAVIAVGSEGRLIRAVLEPVCPVPFVAWPWPGLPGWVGPLDLVLILATEGSAPALIESAQEATRRGARILIAAPEASSVAEFAASRSTTLVGTSTGDPLAAAMLVLAALHELHLGPPVSVESVADAADMVAEAASPFVDLSSNSAKGLACAVADAQPLVWGGSVLSARAARRVASALRAVTGRAALSADADDLIAVIRATEPVNPFADPFEDGPKADRRPCLLIMDDGESGVDVARAATALRVACDRVDVRSDTLQAGDGEDLARYVTLLQKGRFVAAYLGIGLGASLDG